MSTSFRVSLVGQVFAWHVERYLTDTLWPRSESGHRHTSFRAESQLTDGMPNGRTGRKARNIEATNVKLNNAAFISQRSFEDMLL